MDKVDFIVNKYVYASELFNDKYKDVYRIDIFLDFNFLNIYLRNLKENYGHLALI